MSFLSDKTSFSPRSRQHISNRYIASPGYRKRLNLSGRSIQSVNQTILRSQNNYVERFGQPLPVLITEGLTFSERNTVVSAKIANCGYAWLVCGRRLLIWQYRQNIGQITLQRKSIVSGQCFELQLPHSDLAHRAELVSVFISPGTYSPSCIAVSPEGIVRYWPAVNHEGTSIEQTVDLQGQECDSLTNIDGLGCILATTTCTVVLVQPQYTAGRHGLNCRPLKTPSGWLGGFSKKMSSLIFGSISSEQSVETRLVRVLGVPIDETSWYIYVLAGHSLQKWKLSTNGQEQLIFVAELNRLVCEGFLATVFENCGGDQTDMDTWLLDIQSDRENVILLAAVVNMHLSSQVHYAMICVQTNTNVAPTAFQDFLLLQITGLYRDDDPSDCLSYRFLLCGTTAYVYNQKSITVIKPQEDPDVLEFDGPHDFLLGGSICDNVPIFFLRNHGLVCVCNSNDTGPDINVSAASITMQLEASLNDTAVGNLSLYTLDPEEMMSAFKDTVGQLKAAFIFNVQNQQNACRDILERLFFSEGTFIPGIDSVLDKVVFHVCEDILNDMPASDPRWSGTDMAGIGSSYSMQVLKQLEDKERALSLFFKFLRETQLWNRLSAVTANDNTACTVHVLGDLSEKVIAAITLKNISGNDVLEKCIEAAVSDVEIESESGLTYQDLFFREVTKVQRGLREISTYGEKVANSAQNPAEIANTIQKCNEILLYVLKSVIQYRQTHAENFIPADSARNLAPDYLPWTIVNNADGLYGVLFAQQSLTYNYGIKYTTDFNLSNTLYDQLVCLIDIILDGHKSHLESIKGTEKETLLHNQYEKDRFKLINQLVMDKQWENAALLAEKYLDFKILVIICESTDNQHRLDEYMDRFSKEGFSEYVYSWYMQENKKAKLISRCRMTAKSQNNQTLSDFLLDHPSLSWMKNVFDQNFNVAAETLKNLAVEETESVKRQKTMLSLSKLAKLTVPDGDERNASLERINGNLELINYQEEIPDYVLEYFGYDTVRPPVISPKNLIYLYICPEYKDSTELEFKKALDLLEHIDNDELRASSKLKIWRMAVLRDAWNERNLDCPMEILQNKMFFKLADLAVMLGADPEVLLPPLDILIDDDDEMSSLQEDKNFLFLIKTAYEYIFKMDVVI